MNGGELEAIVGELNALGSPENVKGMARFGINAENMLGVSMVELRKLARGKRDHPLALQLWETGIHEARILASLVDNPKEVTERQMEAWVKDFDSWDVCDQVCIHLFRRTPLASEKAAEWSGREEEFVRRAGYALMATLAVHEKKAPDELFLGFLERIKAGATDERNFVKKAVNWALRQIGKRSPTLRESAIQTAREIQNIPSRSARWIASDALQELERKSDTKESHKSVIYQPREFRECTRM